VAKGRITAWSCDPGVNGFQTTNDYILGLGGEQVTEMGVGGTNNGSTTSGLAWQHTNVYAGGALIATYDNDGLHFYFNDPLGTRRAQTDYAGVLEQTCSSLPFGDGLSCSGGNLQAPTEHHFTGKERDNESGNDYFGARYYASFMGRWMSPDPVFATVDRLADPQQWNMYTYSRNNPLSITDPSGLDFNLTCSGGETMSCSGGYQGQYVYNSDSNQFEFQKTDVDMNDPKDASAGYSDQFGNQYTGSFDQNSGVSFTNTATGATSSNSRFIDGSDETDVNGSSTGAFNGIQGRFNSDCGGSCEAKGSLYDLPGHAGAVSALEKMIGKSFEDNLNFFGGHGKANNYRFGAGKLTHIVDHLDGVNKGKQEIHFEGHAPGSNLQNFVLHQVDAIRDSANHESAQEPRLP
jgi:RHS repeat-associated protein